MLVGEHFIFQQTNKKNEGINPQEKKNFKKEDKKETTDLVLRVLFSSQFSENYYEFIDAISNTLRSFYFYSVSIAHNKT